MSSDLTITFGVPPFSHNVVAKGNTVVAWILEMANVLVENSGVWHTALATPIKLVGSLDLGIKLDTFFDIPPEVDTLMGLGMMYVNTNDCGNFS